MNVLKFRPYQAEDKDRCIEIFMSNTPQYFGVEEAEEFRQFLETLPCDYFVATQDDEMVIMGRNKPWCSAGAWCMQICINKGWGNLCSLNA